MEKPTLSETPSGTKSVRFLASHEVRLAYATEHGILYPSVSTVELALMTLSIEQREFIFSLLEIDVPWDLTQVRFGQKTIPFSVSEIPSDTESWMRVFEEVARVQKDGPKPKTPKVP